MGPSRWLPIAAVDHGSEPVTGTAAEVGSHIAAPTRVVLLETLPDAASAAGASSPSSSKRGVPKIPHAHCSPAAAGSERLPDPAFGERAAASWGGQFTSPAPPTKPEASAPAPPPQRRAPVEGVRPHQAPVLDGTGEAWVASLLEPRWKSCSIAEGELETASPNVRAVGGSSSTEGHKSRSATVAPVWDKQENQADFRAKASSSFSCPGRWLAKERGEQLPFTNTNRLQRQLPRNATTPDLQCRFHSATAGAGFRPEVLPPLPVGRGIRPAVRS